MQTRRCYYHKGVLVTQRVMIAKTYLKGFFLLDLAASIPYDMLVYLLTNDGHHPAYDSSKVSKRTVFGDELFSGI